MAENIRNEQPEFIEKLVEVNRVSKAVKGGTNFAFTALVVVGDGQGKVGFGYAKAKEVPVAIQKSMEKAKSSMVQVSLYEGTLQHPIAIKNGAVDLYMQPASSGTGVIAGGAMRAVFEVVGVKDVLAKCNGTRNKGNVVRTTIKALQEMSSPKYVADKRGKKISEVLGS
nr:30S ribosomal protein S5 [Ostreibacterium oceani]